MIFTGIVIALDLGYNVGFKKKAELRKQIVEHEGTISYIVTKKVLTICLDFIQFFIHMILLVNCEYLDNPMGIFIFAIKHQTINHSFELSFLHIRKG